MRASWLFACTGMFYLSHSRIHPGPKWLRNANISYCIGLAVQPNTMSFLSLLLFLSIGTYGQGVAIQRWLVRPPPTNSFPHRPPSPATSPSTCFLSEPGTIPTAPTTPRLLSKCDRQTSRLKCFTLLRSDAQFKMKMLNYNDDLTTMPI